MTQKTTGIRSILSAPIYYNLFQNFMGAKTWRKKIVDEFIRPKNGDKILDIGCGTAEVLKYLPKNVEYWGYDISEKYIEFASKIYGDRGNFHCALLKDTDINNLPKFDIVFLHHLNDFEAYEIFRIANNGLNSTGKIVTIDGCFVDDQNMTVKMLLKLDRGKNVRDINGYKSIAYSTFQSEKCTITIKHKKMLPYTYCIMECYK